MSIALEKEGVHFSKLMNEEYIETHALNPTSYVKMIQYKPKRSLNRAGQAFAIIVSNNFYEIARKVPLMDGEAYSFNQIALHSLERAKEVVEAIKKLTVTLDNLEEVTMYLTEREKKIYEDGEMADASFYLDETYCYPVVVCQKQINQIMGNNMQAALLKNGWNKAQLEQYYSNF